MSIEAELKNKIKDALEKLGQIVSLDDIVIERPKDHKLGDFSTNVAMKMARVFSKNPMVIAEDIKNHLNTDSIERIEIAKPGFINFFLEKDTLKSVIKTIVTLNDKYGNSDYGKGKKINVEFVSANPTGDLHLGHARGAAIGDSICRLYEKVGYDVTREYYVNDAGNQINNLGLSLRARYHQLFGDNADLPEDGYYGNDIIEIAKLMKEESKDKYLVDGEDTLNYFKRRGVELELEKLNKDLKLFRVDFDKFSYETDIRSQKGVEKVLEGAKKYIYENEGATWLKTSEFEDDKDRVIIKTDGSYTYLLPDIAYHLDKLSRGYDLLVDVLGADHHGYINRMKSALEMFSYPASILEIELIQMVRLFKDGKEYVMSKRTGNAVTLRELCSEVGVDAARYFFVSRASTAHLDFDLDLATEQSSSNPVFYAQYAYARLSTVLNSCQDVELDFEGIKLEHKSEMELLKSLHEYPHIVLDAAVSRSPYKVTTYIQKLATLIHGFYTECRIINREDIETTASRLGLAKACQIVLKDALSLIGVSAPEKM